MPHQIAEGAALAAQQPVSRPAWLRNRTVLKATIPAARHAVLDDPDGVGRSPADRPVSTSAPHFAGGARSISALMKPAVLHDVEAEKPEWLVDVGGDVLDRTDRHRAQRERNARRLRRPAGENLAVAIAACRAARPAPGSAAVRPGSPRMVVERSRFDTSTRMRWPKI